MAIELCRDSVKLDGQERIFNRTTGEEVPIEDLQNALREFYGDIQTMILIKKGMIKLTLAEYSWMPNTGRQALDIFEKVTDVKPTA
jgi:hypothetical protein